MLAQERLIAGVREVCRTDDGLDAALMYGSFAQGIGDAHSDVEFWLFFRPEHPVEPRAWCERVAPVSHLVVNEFGTHVVFFPRLVRGEFHFATTGQIDAVRTWPARTAPVERMLVLDRRGALGAALHTLPERVASPRTWEEIETVCGRFANWLVLAHHVARRGETLRALDALSHARRHLLWLARLADDRTDHWLTPSRRAEIDLPAHTVAALGETTTTADPAQVDAAVRAAWRHGRRWWAQLADRHGRPVPAELFRQLDDAR